MHACFVKAVTYNLISLVINCYFFAFSSQFLLLPVKNQIKNKQHLKISLLMAIVEVFIRLFRYSLVTVF